MKYLILLLVGVGCNQKNSRIEDNISNLKSKRDSLRNEYQIANSRSDSFLKVSSDFTAKSGQVDSVSYSGYLDYQFKAAKHSKDADKIDKQIEVLEIEKLKQ